MIYKHKKLWANSHNFLLQDQQPLQWKQFGAYPSSTTGGSNKEPHRILMFWGRERGRAAVPPLLHALFAVKMWMCQSKVLVVRAVIDSNIWFRGHNRKAQALQSDFKSAVTSLLNCFYRDSYEISSWKEFTGKYMLVPIKAQPPRPSFPVEEQEIISKASAFSSTELQRKILVVQKPLPL